MLDFVNASANLTEDCRNKFNLGSARDHNHKFNINAARDHSHKFSINSSRDHNSKRLVMNKSISNVCLPKMNHSNKQNLNQVLLDTVKLPK